MKKLLSAILVMALLLCLTACENASSITPPGSNNSPQQESSVNPSDIKPETSEDPAGESHQPESSEQSNPEQSEQSEQPEKDPLEGLLVSEEFAKNPIQSWFSVNLMRGDKLYHLGARAQDATWKEYGRKSRDYKNRDYLLLYYPAQVDESIWVIGDVPIPVFEPATDKLAVFTTGQLPPDVTLTRVEYAGYTIPMSCAYGYTYSMFDQEGNYTYLESNKISGLAIVDESGKEIRVGDCLEENTKVLVSWYEGINYYEKELTASYKLYKARPELGYYELTPTLTKYGYCELDVSSIPAGLYILPFAGEYDGDSGLLEIR